MITFKLSYNNKAYTFTCELNDTILVLKNKIIEALDLQTKYIDLYYIVDKPIRGMGKFTIENGISPRTMDNNMFTNYNLDNKVLEVSFVIVDDYNIIQKDKKLLNLGKYKPKSIESTSKHQIFNLDSDNDFPPLM